MDASYYHDYAKLERSHWWFKARNGIIYQFVKDTIKPNQRKPIKILNVGCGTGRTTELLSQLGEVTSIEYDHETAEFAAESTGLSVEQGDVKSLKFKNEEFDLVCAFDVIEHVDDDVLAVEEMYRVLKKDGKLIITVPACPFLWSEHDEINHHFRRYTKSSLETTFSNSSFNSCEFISYFNFFLFPLVAGYRLISHIIRKKDENKYGAAKDFKFGGKSGWSSDVFERILGSEYFLLKKGLPFPVGVSLIAKLKK